MSHLRPTRVVFAVLALLLCAFSAPAFAADDQQAPPPASPPPTVVPQSPAPLISLTGSTPEALERQGDQLRAQKRYLDALDYYRAAVAKEPTAMRWNKIGMTELFLQKNDAAEKSFRNALKLDKKSPEALNNLGFMQQMHKDYGKAIKYYNKALAARPNSATFHYNLASAYFGKKDYNKATLEYHTAYQLDADIFNRVSRVGIMAQSSSPEDRAAFSFMVAKMYAQAGDFDNSLQYLRRAMEEGYKQIQKVYTDSEFASLRTDKRFAELMMQKPQALQ